MLSCYFFPSTKRCFEKNPSFGYAPWYIGKLKAKRDELKKIYDEITEADRPKSLACRKYDILNALIEKLEASIHLFNDQLTSSKTLDNLRNDYELMVNLVNLCVPVLDEHYKLLEKPRDGKKMCADGCLQGFSYIILGSSLIAFPMSCGTSFIFSLGVLVSADLIRYLSGTCDPRAYSAYLLVELTRGLIESAGKIGSRYQKLVISDALATLGLTEMVSAAEIRSVYRKKSLLVHSDRHPGHEEEFIKLTNAKDTLLKYLEEQEKIKNELENAKTKNGSEEVNQPQTARPGCRS